MIFIKRIENEEIIILLKSLKKDFFDIPIYFINKLEKSNDKKTNEKYFLEIGTIDQRILKLTVLSENKDLFLNLHKIINPLEFMDILRYPIKFKQNHKIKNDGWKIYKLKKEFKRQGLKIFDTSKNEKIQNNNPVQNVFFFIFTKFYLKKRK